MILIDINVVLDLLQNREPHVRASGQVIERVLSGEVEGALPAHAITTLHYLVAKYQTKAKADDLVSWLLKYFLIAPVNQENLRGALYLGWPDFEDAVVATCAEALQCEVIVTRNIKDFRKSPVAAMTPTEFLLNR